MGMFKTFHTEVIMIDVEIERVIAARQVPEYVPSRSPGKKVSPATVWRWMLRKNNPLETIKIGGGRFTSIEAINRFIHLTGTNKASEPSARSRRAGQQLQQLIRRVPRQSHVRL